MMAYDSALTEVLPGSTIYLPLVFRNYTPPATFTLLHTNDFHGNLESDYKGRGGSAYMAGVIDDVRAEEGEDNVLLVDAGDAFFGAPPISQLLMGESAIDVYNMLGYDVAAFGNHEFDGQDVLQDRVEQSDFPWIGANIVLDGTAWEHPDWVEPYVILEAGGVDVGFIGLDTDETPLVTLKGTTDGLEFKDLTQAVLHYYDEVMAQSDALVVLAHMGTQDSGAFAGLETVAQELTDAGKPVDLMIGGHQHEYLDEPVYVGDTAIIVAYNYGRVLGKADIEVYPQSKSLELVDYEYITINDELVPDAEVEARVTYWADQVAPLVSQVVGYTNVDLVRNYNDESNMGNLVADSMLWKADAYDDGAVNDSVDIAFTNPGGLRADIEIPTGATTPYTVTWGDTFNVLPFGNTLFLMDLTGAQVRTLLNQSASLYKGIMPTAGATWYWYNDCQCDTPTSWGTYTVTVGGAPLDPGATYRVVTNNFLAGGQDGWVTFAEGTNRWDTYYDMQAGLNEYIEKYNDEVGPIDYAVEGRIVYVP
jgi:2',3'-cyclic-nucleotide 2'-phosphodiesterase (5'-nucleotidase family)